MLSQFMMCINRTLVSCVILEIDLIDRFIPQKELLVFAFSFFFFFFIPDPLQDSLLGWRKDFSLPSPVSLHASNIYAIYIASTFEGPPSQTCKGGVHLWTACRIFFYPLQIYVRYVYLKSPPAPSPFLIQHGTHDYTIKHRSFDHWLPRERSASIKTERISSSVQQDSWSLDSSRVLKRADFDAYYFIIHE